MEAIGNLLSISVYEGFAYGFVALGVYITFRVLAFPDLTVDGSFPLGQPGDEPSDMAACIAR